jgi:hypothetical protein
MRRTLLRQLRYLPLVRALVGPGRDHRQRVADCPERQQPDAELALQTLSASLRLQPPLDRIADVGGHVLEVGPPVTIARDPSPSSLTVEVVFAVLAAASTIMRIAFQSSPILSLP